MKYSFGLQLTSQKSVLQFFQVTTRIFVINPHSFLVSISYTFPVEGYTIWPFIEQFFLRFRHVVHVKSDVFKNEGYDYC